uniref:Fork-head domain-containing protein n=1 Tax=Romanomermis culicivorax TaxID=13658 RepID=A0A915HZI8_ROMCU
MRVEKNNVDDVQSQEPCAASCSSECFNSKHSRLYRKSSEKFRTTKQSGGKSKFHHSNRSYVDWISKAILDSDNKRLSLSQIIDWMIENVPDLKKSEPTSSRKGWKAIISSTLNSNRNDDVFVKTLHRSGRYFLYGLLGETAKRTRKIGRNSSSDVPPILAMHPKFGKSFSRWIAEAIASHPQQLMSKEEILKWMSENIPGIKECNRKNEKRWKKGVTDALRRRNTLFFGTFTNDTDNGIIKQVYGINHESRKKTYHIGKGKRRLFEDEISSDYSADEGRNESDNDSSEESYEEENDEDSSVQILKNKRRLKVNQSPDRFNDHEYCSTTISDVKSAEKIDHSSEICHDLNSNISCEKCGASTTNHLLSQILAEMRQNSTTSRELLQIQSQLLKGQQETNQRLDQLLKKISPKTRTFTLDEHDYNMDSIEVIDWEIKCV